jgi:hypothetical protein
VGQVQEILDEDHEQLFERVCAIDVAKVSGKVCTRLPQVGGRPGARVSPAIFAQNGKNANSDYAWWMNAGNRTYSTTWVNAYRQHDRHGMGSKPSPSGGWRQQSCLP